VTTWKGVTGLLKVLCNKEGKAGNIVVLVFSIAIWNYMHVGSVPWNNKLITVH